MLRMEAAGPSRAFPWLVPGLSLVRSILARLKWAGAKSGRLASACLKCVSASAMSPEARAIAPSRFAGSAKLERQAGMRRQASCRAFSKCSPDRSTGQLAGSETEPSVPARGIAPRHRCLKNLPEGRPPACLYCSISFAPHGAVMPSGNALASYLSSDPPDQHSCLPAPWPTVNWLLSYS